MTESVFANYIPKAYPYRYKGTLLIGRIAGGTPTDPKVAEGWIKTKLGHQSDDLIRKQIAEVMVTRGITDEQAVEEVNSNRHLNGFKHDNETGLYIEGRHLKAALKEAVSICVSVGKLPSRGWGLTNKGSKAFVAEHICVIEDKLPLGLTEPTGIAQRFVHTHTGTGIQYEEYCDNVTVNFTVVTDHKFTDEQWAMIWLTGQQQGIGATRSQGYGRYTVTRWETVKAAA